MILYCPKCKVRLAWAGHETDPARMPGCSTCRTMTVDSSIIAKPAEVATSRPQKPAGVPGGSDGP